MTIQQILFIVISVVVLGAAVLVVTTRNLFHAALFLVASFFGVAAYYVLLDAGFFAAVQVLIYIGAISILFIFAVMLTRDVITAQRANSQWIAAAVIAALIFVITAILLGPVPVSYPTITIHLGPWVVVIPARQFGNVQWLPPGTDPKGVTTTVIADLGRALVDFNRYAVPFLLTGVILFVAMVGAIWVARDLPRRDKAIADETDAATEAQEAGLYQEPLPLPDNAVAADKH